MEKRPGSELSQSVQDYLKIIHKLQVNGSVSTTVIAKELHVSGASVTGMLKKLESMGLVDYNRYRGAQLSDKGNKAALEIIRLHRLLELYLKEKMGFGLDRVHGEACRMEHSISEQFSNKLDEILGHPEFDPHGHPIPSKNGEMPKIKEYQLSIIEPVTQVMISHIADENERILAYLEEQGLLPNVKIDVLEKEPFNGPITISYNGIQKVIGYEIAKDIFVKIV